MRKTRPERAEKATLTATVSNAQPAAFPLGSLESRAAARSLIAGRAVAEEQGILVVVRRIGLPQDPNRKCTCKRPSLGAFALCRCFS